MSPVEKKAAEVAEEDEAAVVVEALGLFPPTAPLAVEYAFGSKSIGVDPE